MDTRRTSMDIYSQGKLIANSTTFVNVSDKKVKGILLTNSGAAGTATLHLWGSTGGTTFQTQISVGASASIGSFILPVKVAGASTSGSNIQVIGLY